MQEAEVSLRVAIYYIKGHYTEKDVRVSLDGAHIKTKDKVHFDIDSFLSQQGCVKVEGPADSWQGTYCLDGYEPRLVISSIPGVGDVNIFLRTGKQLYVESKKGKEGNKSNSEYALMREAIGQLMTGCPLAGHVIPTVAVPYTKKSYELASKWVQLKQICLVGISFILVHQDGMIEYISADCGAGV